MVGGENKREQIGKNLRRGTSGKKRLRNASLSEGLAGKMYTFRNRGEF